MDNKSRNFGLTSLSLKNKTSVFILTILLTLFGLFAYKNMPKSLFPDIVMPTIMVQTVYPGNSPADQGCGPGQDEGGTTATNLCARNLSLGYPDGQECRGALQGKQFFQSEPATQAQLLDQVWRI